MSSRFSDKMAVCSSPRKKVVAHGSKDGFMQVEVTAVAGRNVHLLQQCRKVQSDGSTFSSLARQRKEREKKIKETRLL